jgi:negative regulator of replication initiation
MAKKIRTTISVDVEDAEYLRSLAKSQGLSLADVCRLALKQWINQRKAAKTSQNQQQS